MSRHPLAARDVPPGEPWTFEHPSMKEVIAAKAEGKDATGPGQPPRPAARPGDDDAAFLALKELAFASAAVAEALSWPRHARRSLQLAEARIEAALVNVKRASGGS
ncbi:MAG TPA: hypothetical protein VM755_00105 [Stellaceae bacterium]|nr:hypothetical protein [Stellaceae bacterium]